MSERADVVIPEAAAVVKRLDDLVGLAQEVYRGDDLAGFQFLHPLTLAWILEAVKVLRAAVPLLGSEREGVEPMSYREGIKAAGHAMQPSLAILEKRALAAERERDEAVALLREAMMLLDLADDYNALNARARPLLSRLSDQETKR